MASTIAIDYEDDYEKFFLSVITHLSWGDLEDDIVMDIGCGLGLYSTKDLNIFFPKIKKIIGLDFDPLCIEIAKNQLGCDKFEFYQADIQDEATYGQWKSKISNIISIDCFDWVSKRREGFKGIYDLLKPGGSAALMFNISQPLRDVLDNLIEHTGWSKTRVAKEGFYPRFPSRRLNAAENQQLASEVGFEIVHCKVIRRSYEFKSEDIFYEITLEFVNSCVALLPSDQHDRFSRDFTNAFIEMNGTTVCNIPQVQCKTLILLIRKPCNINTSKNKND